MHPQQQEIVLVFEGVGGLGAIFISNLEAANNSNTLRSHHILAVVSAGRGLMLTHPKEVISDYLYLPIDDTEGQSLSPYLDPSYKFIQANLRRGNVLVHCHMGISRSSAMVAAYLIRKYGYSMPQAVKLLRGKKPNVNPNRSFIRQLHVYQQSQHPQQEGDYQRLRDSLVGSLARLTKNKDEINDKIRKVHESLSNRSRQKRSKSEYLQKRVEECLMERSRRNSLHQMAPTREPNSPLLHSPLREEVHGPRMQGGRGKELDMSLLAKKLVGVS